MYICIYVYMYICIHVYVYICICICVCIWGSLQNACKELLNPRAVNIRAVMYFRLHYKAESCIYAVKTLSCKLALDLR